jgi:sialate O-acetylesterase
MTAASYLPNIRFAVVPRTWSVEPKKTRAAWTRCLPSELAGGRLVSAVAFYYARELHLALGVPVGIVSVNWGGTNIDAWTPRCGYEGCDPSLKPFADYPVKRDWNRAKDRKWTIGGAHQQPTVLWNGMVSAWAPMAARGFIWYQGCHNAGESEFYCAKMHALYNGWAKAFENPSLKLYFVQLAPYTQNWMKLVAAQNRFAAEEKNAAIAVTADVGNFSDIHPNNKEIVAKRLAVHALKNDYGFAISETDSPVFKSAAFDGATAKLTFDNVRSWYVYADDRSVTPAFELAGADGVWHPAKLLNVEKSGKVKGTTLELTSDKVARPVRARYLGRKRTMGTVYNEVSLPLGPFETL